MKQPFKLLLQQVRLLDPISNTDRIADVLIIDGEIKAIEAQLSSVSEETVLLKAEQLVLAPGLVDLYSYSGEPGHEERETLLSSAVAAAAGGFTRLTLLPDTTPPIDNSAVLSFVQQKKQKLREAHICAESSPQALFSFPTPLLMGFLPEIQFWAALTVGVGGKQMAELFDLARDAVGLADGRPIEDLGLLRQLLEYAKPLGKPVALVVTNRQLQGSGVVREGILSLRYGLPGDPAVSESAAIAALLELVAMTGTPVHLMRVSTRRGVELIAEGKARGLPIAASTTWMHLLLDTQAIHSYDPNLRLDPPLGNQTDREALIEGVKQGIIDAIAVDHIPHTYEEKTVAFTQAPPGAIGFELILPLLWQHFVERGEWSALQLWQALCTGPQRCLQQEPSRCAVGQQAELVLFDPQQTWVVSRQTLKSLSTNTPWLGKQLTGRVVGVLNFTD